MVNAKSGTKYIATAENLVERDASKTKCAARAFAALGNIKIVRISI